MTCFVFKPYCTYLTVFPLCLESSTMLRSPKLRVPSNQVLMIPSGGEQTFVCIRLLNYGWTWFWWLQLYMFATWEQPFIPERIGHWLTIAKKYLNSLIKVLIINFNYLSNYFFSFTEHFSLICCQYPKIFLAWFSDLGGNGT